MAAPVLSESAPHPRLPADERRRQLLEVSIDLFSKKGFAGTTTKEIAGAAGVTEAIIFRHFATKQDLYGAILEHMASRAETDEWLRGAEALMDRNDDAGLVRYLMKGALEFARMDPRYERLMLFAALEGNELALLHQNSMSALAGRFIDYIERRQREGAIIGTHPHLVMSAMVGVIKFYISRKYLFQCGEGMDDEQALQDLTRIILNGIRLEQSGKAN